MFAAITTFVPNDDVFVGMKSRFAFSPSSKSVGGVAPPMVVFDENHYGVFMEPSIAEFMRLRDVMCKHRLFVTDGEVKPTDSMDGDAITEVEPQDGYSFSYGMRTTATLADVAFIGNMSEHKLYVAAAPREDEGFQLPAPRESTPIGPPAPPTPPPDPDAPAGAAAGPHAGAPPAALFETTPDTLLRRRRCPAESPEVRDLREDVFHRVEVVCKKLRRDMLAQRRDKALNQVNALFEHLKEQPGFGELEFRNHAMVDPMLVENFNRPRGRHNIPPETYARPGHYQQKPSPSWKRRSAKNHLLAVLVRSMHRKLNMECYKLHVTNRERTAAHRRVDPDAALTNRELCEHVYHNSGRSYWTEEAMESMKDRLPAAEAYLTAAAMTWLLAN